MKNQSLIPVYRPCDIHKHDPVRAAQYTRASERYLQGLRPARARSAGHQFVQSCAARSPLPAKVAAVFMMAIILSSSIPLAAGLSPFCERFPGDESCRDLVAVARVEERGSLMGRGVLQCQAEHALITSSLNSSTCRLRPSLQRQQEAWVDRAQNSVTRIKALWEKTYPNKANLTQAVAPGLLPSLIIRNKPVMERARKELLQLRRMECELIAALCEKKGLAYDKARRAIYSLEQKGSVAEIGSVLAAFGLENSRELAERYHVLLKNMDESEQAAMNALREDPAITWNKVNDGDLYQYISLCFQELYDLPAIKKIDRPLFVFVNGASGSGKSSTSVELLERLHCKLFSTDDIREVMRRSFFLIGEDVARSTFPELYQASFEAESQKDFYAHSLLIMEGVRGALNRAMKEGSSMIVEGTVPVFWFLDDSFITRANTISLVISPEKSDDFARRLTKRNAAADVDRGGAARYLSRITTIEAIQADLLSKGVRKRVKVLFNREDAQQELVRQALDQIQSPFVNRAVETEDVLRDQVTEELIQRMKSIKLV